MNGLKVIGRERIGQIEFTGIEGGFGKGKKAMLVKDIARIHGTTTKRVNELINRNRNRFADGIDIIDLLTSGYFKVVLNDLNFGSKEISNANNIYLLSERGYAKLLKILEDDKAWEVYDQLVDNYFNMRSAVQQGNPSIVANKRLEIMEANAKTRRAGLLYKLAMATKSESSSEAMLALAAKELTGEMTIPVLKQKEYSAGEAAKKLGISSGQKVGKIANKIGIKAEQPGQNEYGRWTNSKSRYSDKEVPQWVYSERGVQAIKSSISKQGTEG
ncbi:MAG: ORF6N domain-containing protein [Schleiferilactobacillus perolens]|uniref:ORF6N domain-containing protein n=1 Tax=Schleiferilactobacillus perolens TaxID=100468 RepID=UPI0039E9AAEB